MLTLPSVCCAEFPARSRHWPVPCWPAPSAIRVCELAVATTPESASEHDQLRVTLVLFQPFAFAAGLGPTKLIVGLVLSIFTSPSVLLATLPARSWHVPVPCWCMPSVEIVCESEAAITPDRLSEQVQLSATSTLFQPLAFLAGLWLAELIVGAVLSRLTLPSKWVALFPARSRQIPVAC